MSKTTETGQPRRILFLATLCVFAFLPLAAAQDTEPAPLPVGFDDAHFLHTKDNPDVVLPEPFDSSNANNALLGLQASTISFQFMNNNLVMNQVFEHLRGIPLVTYHGEEVAPAAGGTAVYPTGGYDTAPFGPGYAPAYEPSMYNSGYPVYDQNGVPIQQTSGAMSDIYRGQANVGDPGTLIYSLWGGAIGGKGKVKNHGDYLGYDTEQFGGLVGIDLFCSTDCRSGLFYAYQEAKIKKQSWDYIYGLSGGSSLTNLVSGDLTVTPPEPDILYTTDYTYNSTFYGYYDGTVKANNHLLGLYHQFGDEFIYNIATLRGGYNTVKTNQTFSETGSSTVSESFSYTEDPNSEPAPDPVPYDYQATGFVNPYTTDSVTDRYSLSAKQKNYLAGASFERGAHFKFQPFTITPRGAIDYTYMYRDKYDTTINGKSLYFKKGSYHSLRTNVGGDVALDMYPGQSSQIQLLLRGSWIHEFLGSLDGKTSYYTNDGFYGTYYGNSMGRDWAILGGTVDWTIVPSFSVFANYDYMVNKYLKQHYGTLGAALHW